MKIKFKSIVFQNNNEKEIEFSAPVELTKEGEFQVLSFYEPSNNIANRIEISNQRINIFAGPTTLYIILDPNQSALNVFELQTPEGIGREMDFYTQIIKHEFDYGKQYFFEYELFQKQSDKKEVFGNFKIYLTLEN
ncbi:MULTISPECIES: DUF1934 family protein [unclassified Mycoplasma]|uniref:DUF1934 family protein n=1 Tax=unclassified Mycoplasma TaxID=2683645 RepID=UPI00211BF0FA|nr:MULTISPECIES: DUF1934 family protein [unclassified Mycoplasma]UUM19944.1 DUF1934 family protein [Mycoplasma sp. 1578d]UUM24925.1 DUF1934 family protein [Mycoplasma sp. 3686d]